MNGWNLGGWNATVFAGGWVDEWVGFGEFVGGLG